MGVGWGAARSAWLAIAHGAGHHGGEQRGGAQRGGAQPQKRSPSSPQLLAPPAPQAREAEGTQASLKHSMLPYNCTAGLGSNWEQPPQLDALHLVRSTLQKAAAAAEHSHLPW